MQNEVRSERLNETITGTINGCNATINYETANDPIPRTISATCTILSEIDPMQNTVINISINVMGSMNWTIAAVPKDGDLPLIIASVEAIFGAFMVNPV